MRPRAEGLNPLDDKYYTPVGAGWASTAGQYVSADTAMRTSAVYACVRVISDSLASMPLAIYRSRDDGGRDKAPYHPVYDLLHDQPNRRHTAFEFKKLILVHILLRGNAYAEIKPGPRGPVDQLVPLHPDTVTVEELAGGGLRYSVKQGVGQPDRKLNDDQVFHVRGLTLDGVHGVSVIEYARETIGLTLAAESSGARLHRNDSTPGGVLQVTKTLSKEGSDRLKADWESGHGGANQGRVAILEQGTEWKPVAISPRDAEWLETRQFQVEDVARFFGMPLHMIQSTEKSTSWGSGLEQMSLGFIVFTLLPFAVGIEQAVKRDLIVESKRYFAKFNLNALARGDMAARGEFYATGRDRGYLNANEIRAWEDLNPIPGGDVYLVPLNMTDGAQPAQPAPGGEPRRVDAPADGGDGQAGGIDQATETRATARVAPTDELGAGHYRLLLEEAAGRVVRKEIAAMQRALSRCGKSNEAWLGAVLEFYGEHRAFVAQTMRMTEPAAEEWCDIQAARWLERLPELETMDGGMAQELADLAEANHV